MTGKQVRVGIKVAQMTGLYDDAKEAWLEADRLGFDTAWAHDHLLNQNDHSKSEDEGWTILTALLVESRRIRGGLMVTANTFRPPGVLAKIATTVDVVSGGRVEVGLGAGQPGSVTLRLLRGEACALTAVAATLTVVVVPVRAAPETTSTPSLTLFPNGA